MKTLLKALVLGWLIIWGFNNIPNFTGILFVGLIGLLLVNQFNTKK